MQLDIPFLAGEAMEKHGTVHLGDVTRRLSTNRLIRRYNMRRAVIDIDRSLEKSLSLMLDILENIPAEKHLTSNFVALLREASMDVPGMNTEERVEKQLVCHVRDAIGHTIKITRNGLEVMGRELFQQTEQHRAELPPEKLQEISLDILCQTIKVSVEELFRSIGLLSQERTFMISLSTPDESQTATEKIAMVLNVAATVNEIARRTGIPIS